MKQIEISINNAELIKAAAQQQQMPDRTDPHLKVDHF